MLERVTKSMIEGMCINDDQQPYTSRTHIGHATGSVEHGARDSHPQCPHDTHGRASLDHETYTLGDMR